jgi:TRAP-type C4-dicarboxylate transport system substrate-binding protein
LPPSRYRYLLTENVLFASDEAMTSLGESQAAILREAAVKARDAATDAITEDSQAAGDFCDAGGQVVLASDA